MEAEYPASAEAAIRRYLKLGMLGVIALVAGVGGVGAFAKVSGAVIAPGVFVVDSHVKKAQHPHGGVIAVLPVREGDRVKAGDLLVRLDDTETRANLAIVENRLNDGLARKARLEAERDDLSEIDFPDSLLAGRGNRESSRFVDAERRLFLLRRASRNGKRDQLASRIEQLERQRLGIVEQAAAITAEIALMEKEIGSLRTLWKRRLIALDRITAAERDSVRLIGEQGQLKAALAQIEGQKSEVQLQIIQIDQDLRSEVAHDLGDVEAAIAENSERKVSVEDELKHVEMRAPQDGVVEQLAVHTIGEVIGPGETVMLIVPDGDDLAVDARIPPQEIDRIEIGRSANLRLSALNQATTPELTGIVQRVSADLMTDEHTGQSFYSVRVSVPVESLAMLAGTRLVSGMPVEVFLETPSRSMLSYFFKPITDQFERTFRDD